MKKNLNRVINFLTLFLLFGAFVLTISAQNDKRIEEIQKIYRETNEKIAESNENGEYSSVYLSELVVNKNNGSYPAVGNYKTVAKFYYTYGDREKNPYPNRLLKIEIETNRAARTENSEFLFNEAGQLIFYFGKKDETELRIYFSAEKTFKIQSGAQNLNPNVKTSLEMVKKIMADKRKLGAIFLNSLEF